MIPFAVDDVASNGLESMEKLAAAQAANPPVRVVQSMEKSDRVAFSNGTSVYFVDMNISLDKGVQVVSVPITDERAQGYLNFVSKVDEYIPMGETTKSFVQELKRLNEAALREKDNSYGNEMEKILQYNYGNQESLSMDHPYIPNHFDKENSLELMRNVAVDIHRQGVLNNNDDMRALSEKIMAFSRKLQDPFYDEVHVQSVFNTISEREPELMGSMKRFENELNKQKLRMNFRESVKSLLGDDVFERGEQLAGSIKDKVVEFTSGFGPLESARSSVSNMFENYQNSFTTDVASKVFKPAEVYIPIEIRLPSAKEVSDRIDKVVETRSKGKGLAMN